MLPQPRQRTPPPGQLPNKAVAEFQALYVKHIGVALTTEEARQCATDFVALYRSIYFPRRE